MTISNKFWTAALGVGGLATVGAAVLYGLYDGWLHLAIFQQVSAHDTFVLMLVFLSLVFLIAVTLGVLWLIDRRNSRLLPTGVTEIAFTVPRNCSFQQGVIALAKEDSALAEFRGFTRSELERRLSEQELKTSNTLQAIRLVGGLAVPRLRAYEVERQPGCYLLTTSRTP